MPDWLSRQMPYQGEVPDDADEDVAIEAGWLRSCIRNFQNHDPELGEVAKAPAPIYRSATVWWMIMIDTFLWIRVSAGLEAFSSHQTADAAKKLSGPKADPKYLEQLVHLCKSRFGFQWLALGIDQWSVGVCGCNMLRYGLRLFVEPIFDFIHGLHRDIFRGMSLANLWIYFLCMRILYCYNFGPWNGGKHLVEGAEIIKELFANPATKAEIKELWITLWPDMCRDDGRQHLVHNEFECLKEFEAFPESDLMTSKGPRMTITGWMSYERGFDFWDRRHTRRTFAVTLICWKRGVLKGSIKSVCFQSVRCEKVLKGAEPGMTKKAREKNTADLRSLGVNITHTIGILHGQGWFLQRRIRLCHVAPIRAAATRHESELTLKKTCPPRPHPTPARKNQYFCFVYLATQIYIHCQYTSIEVPQTKCSHIRPTFFDKKSNLDLYV